jgi:magnesium chelatase subunit I
MVELLDEYIPFVTGSEINDVIWPISRYAKDLILRWRCNCYFMVAWSDRFFEKLATGVTVADLIGDIDPIKQQQI